MVIAVVLVIGIATLLFLKYLESLDRYKSDKKTKWMMAVGVAVGVASVPVTLLLYELNPFAWIARATGALGPLGYHILVVGLTEEIGKYGCFIAMVLAARSIKEPQDGIIQGAAVGLGFQAAEDIIYGLNWGLEVAILRTLYFGLHMLTGALWGYAFAAAFYNNLESQDSRSVGYALLAVVPAAVFHGLYNTLIGVGSVTDSGPAMETVLAALMLIVAIAAFRHMVRHSPYRVYPYHRHREAVRSIHRGLLLNPTSVVLNRRMALYLIAGGRYEKALGYIRVCQGRVKKRTMYDALEAIALMGAEGAGGASAASGGTSAATGGARSGGDAGGRDRGPAKLEAAADKLAQEGRKTALENQLQRILREEWLRERALRILRTYPNATATP